MDTVASLSPDLIVANTDLPAAAIKQLREIAPVLTIDSADSADQIARMEGNLDLIAEATGTTDKAEELKTAFEAKVAEGKKALTDAGLAGREIAFADGYVVSNQVSIRPYTGGSLIGNVNTALGLKNAWSWRATRTTASAPPTSRASASSATSSSPTSATRARAPTPSRTTSPRTPSGRACRSSRRAMCTSSPTASGCSAARSRWRRTSTPSSAP